MSDGYSPNWSPGDPLTGDEKISQDEKEEIVRQGRAAGWTDEDEAEFWADDQSE